MVDWIKAKLRLGSWTADILPYSEWVSNPWPQR